MGAHTGAVESLVKTKERELALALMRVAELTRQLQQLRLGQLDGVLVDSTSTHARLLDHNPEVCLLEIFTALLTFIFQTLSFFLFLKELLTHSCQPQWVFHLCKCIYTVIERRPPKVLHLISFE